MERAWLGNAEVGDSWCCHRQMQDVGGCGVTEDCEVQALQRRENGCLGSVHGARKSAERYSKGFEIGKGKRGHSGETVSGMECESHEGRGEEGEDGMYSVDPWLVALLRDAHIEVVVHGMRVAWLRRPLPKGW